MKKILALLLALTLLLSLCACTDKTPSDQIPDTTPSDSTPDIPPSTGTGGAGDENTDPWSEYQIITVAQALELCGESGNVTEERYYLRGTVVSVDNATYGAMTI